MITTTVMYMITATITPPQALDYTVNALCSEIKLYMDIQD